MVRQTDRSPSRAQDATAAGLSGGTGFAGIVLLLPDSMWKSVLLIFAPTITVIIGSSWHILTDEISFRVAEWRIQSQIRRDTKRYNALNADDSASDNLKRQAQ